MKTVKSMVMGAAAVVVLSAFGVSSVSAQGHMPQAEEGMEIRKTSKAVTIDGESDQYEVIGMGSEAVTDNEPITFSDAAGIIHITGNTGNVIVKSNEAGDKLLISRNGGKTWSEMDEPENAE